MPTPKGQLLYVSVSPSEARRRLRGFGHGVRKVQSAGKNRAVIIHTATGGHLHELKAVFADVGFSEHESDLAQPIESLRNLGPQSAAWLREAGVATVGALQRLGPVAAYRLVKQRRSRTSVNLLWALAAGLKDVDWRRLSEREKQALRQEIERA